MRHVRAAIAASLAAGALAACSPGAAASGAQPVTINTPLTTMTANNASIRINTATGPHIATCAAIQLPAAITPVGNFSVAAGTAVFNGCQVMGVAIAVTQPVAWSGIFRHLDSGALRIRSFTLDMIVPMGGLHLSILGCQFDMNGIPLADHVFAAEPLHRVLVNVPNIQFPASLVRPIPLLLTVRNLVGASCALLPIANLDAGQLTANFAFAPAVVGMGT
ncbi:hypothetical protein VSS74_12505 [Conexibacter stalactiti]|uniref:Uncharacterized protein n=1 Tax=Conexibacter stalactiti TaxID=1940611 RepID=A0ABU4HPJ1_9ACTN|nr:hypothetical protein [Conexibacter stalactiti]MDW5595164.1 hypothetical protein [Conexibacter stalactiti]MEC5035806.1 hypothetical protein [Conexibacter stalactiti]